MFLIPTYVGRSAIHGVGVFTPGPLRAGQLIWLFDDQVDWLITAGDLDRFPASVRARIKEYCYRLPNGAYVLCGDNAKFMNHSASPNCDDSGERTVTMRAIAAGEELTCDYRHFDVDSMTAAPAWMAVTARDS